MKILIVDDYPDMIELLQDFLKSLVNRDFLIETASSGVEAIDKLKKYKRFDLVISDYMMKNGTGKDVLDYLIKIKSSIPFILFSSMRLEQCDLAPYNEFYFIGKDDYRGLGRVLTQILRPTPDLDLV